VVGSSLTNFATSTSTCSISLAKVVRRCTIANDNVPNVLAILLTTTVNAFPLAILRGGSGQTPVRRPAHRPVTVAMARNARRWVPSRLADQPCRPNRHPPSYSLHSGASQRDFSHRVLLCDCHIQLADCGS